MVFQLRRREVGKGRKMHLRPRLATVKQPRHTLRSLTIQRWCLPGNVMLAAAWQCCISRKMRSVTVESFRADRTT